MAMFKFYVVIIAVQLPSHVWIFETPLTAARQASLAWPTHLPNFAQVHVHCIGDAIQPSLSQPSSPSALSLSQHQGFFQWVSCSYQVTKILEFQFQHQFLRLTGLTSLLFKGLSGVFSSTTAWRHQFFGVLPSLWSSSHNCIWPWGTP